MRAILAWLALAQTRWALADLERSKALDRRSADAMRRAEERMDHAYALANRAGMSRR
jgi:hypothetical protein